MNKRGHRYYGSLKAYSEGRHWEGATFLGLAAGTWATIGIVAGTAASVAGTALSVAASRQQSINQAKLAGSVQRQKEVEAANEAESARFEEQQARRRTAILMGKQTAILGASGVDISSGTPLIQEIDLASQAELNALNVRRTGQISASESMFEGRISRYQGDTARAAIPYEIGAGVLNATAAAGSGAAQYGYMQSSQKLNRRLSMISNWYTP